MSNVNHDLDCKILHKVKHEIDYLLDHDVLSDNGIDKRIKIDLMQLSMDISAYLLFNDKSSPTASRKTP